MLYMGLDLGTQRTGLTILTANGNVLYQTAFVMTYAKRFPDMWTKAKYVKEEMKRIKKELVGREKIKIVIEQNLQMFKSGRSSAKVLDIISKWNGICSFMCYEVFKVNPEYLAAGSARKQAGVTIKRDIDKDAKEQVMDYLVENHDFKLEYNRNGNIKAELFDIADSYILALAAFKTS